MSEVRPTGDAREFAMGPTTVTMASDGAVTGVRHPRRDHSMLLAEGAPGPEGSMHDTAHRWGKGFAILDGRGYRFDAPERRLWRDDGVELSYPLGPLALTVRRRVTGNWSETYELSNPSPEPVDVGSFAVSTPGGMSMGPPRTACSGPCTPTSGPEAPTPGSGRCRWTAAGRDSASSLPPGSCGPTRSSRGMSSPAATSGVTCTCT